MIGANGGAITMTYRDYCEGAGCVRVFRHRTALSAVRDPLGRYVTFHYYGDGDYPTGAGRPAGELAALVPLKPGETWALEELGATASLVPEYRRILPFPPWAGWITTGIGLALASVLLANFPFRRLTEREKCIVWVMAGQCALVAVLWLFYDRYSLVERFVYP